MTRSDKHVVLQMNTTNIMDRIREQRGRFNTVNGGVQVAFSGLQKSTYMADLKWKPLPLS